MPTVSFAASPLLPRWVHEVGGYAKKVYKDGREVQVMVDPVIMRDGEALEMEEWQADWLVKAYPENFKVVDDTRLVDQ